MKSPSKSILQLRLAYAMRGDMGRLDGDKFKVGRPAEFNSKVKIVDALNNLDNLHLNHLTQLMNMGYIDRTKIVSGTRGRPAYTYTLTGKGRGFVALSRTRKRKDGQAEQISA